MEREQLDRLLAEYSTGGLSEDDRKKLFTEALADQELFDQLTEEDALREAIEMPGARNRLIDSLREESVAASVLSMPSPPKAAAPPPSKSMWLAWAAGIGIVFVSGAVTYMMFEGPPLKNLAQVYSEAPKDTKPFVPPPAPVQKPGKVMVEEPPKILAEKRAPLSIARQVNIPLPSAPPPAEPAPANDKKSLEIVLSANAERDRAEFKFRADQQSQAVLPPLSQQQAPAASARRQPAADIAVGSAGADAKKEEGARESKAKLAIAPLSLWRHAGDGVWIRVPAGDAVGRNDTIAVRYVPVSAATVALIDAAGRRVASKPGRVGEELELIVPPALLQRSAGGAIAFSISEGPRSTPLKIFLRRE